MSVVKFSELPDSARVWVFAAERSFSDTEANLISTSMDNFMQEWTAHKRELTTAWDLRYQQFIFIAVDERMMGASGCSIDSMVRNLGELGKRLNTDLVGAHLKVFYRDQASRIQCVDRIEFKRLAQNGMLDEQTIVFNNTVKTIKEIKEGKWETALKYSWHFEVFGRVLV